jgi:hypothetical protein
MKNKPATRRAYRARTVEQRRAYSATYRRANAARVLFLKRVEAHYADARAAPVWLTREQWAEMEVFYAKARQLTELTGVRHVVDHIEPFIGEDVARNHNRCGLHVPWNLQVITHVENSSKRRK